MLFRRLFVILLLVLASLSQAVPSLASHTGCNPGDFECDGAPSEPQTGGDQENGAVVTEGVQFPGVDPASRLGRATSDNAACSNCQWTTAPACLQNGPTDDALCLGATDSCSDPAAIRYRVYMRIPPEPWQLVDTVCLGPGQRPASVADVGEIVRERVVNYLPDAEPSFQPAQGGLVNLPTIFAAGEPSSIRTEPFDVLGFEVVVTATARWEWAFDQGVTESFTEPGGSYPDQSVSWTYARPGDRDVTVTTYWKASYTVNGDGPFAVPGPEISKTAGPLAVPVREARSQLVGG